MKETAWLVQQGNRPSLPGFPNAVYRNWWLPLFPSSCFTVGVSNPLYLTQCVAFSTSF